MIGFNTEMGLDNGSVVIMYRNRDWLVCKYLEEELNSRQIAKICGVSAGTIIYWLRKFNIPLRSNAEAVHARSGNHCDLSQEALEWINGELLGDGCLYSWPPYSAQFTYSSKYLEYIEYVSSTLKSYGTEQSGRITKRYNRRWSCYSYHYHSRRYAEFLTIYKEWYPKGKKIVPRDLELTPLTCRQWYIGDGCLDHRGHRGPRIFLFTNAFPISDIERLVKQLINLGFKSTRRPADNSIGISAYSTKRFLGFINKCPVECYQYKWRLLI